MLDKLKPKGIKVVGRMAMVRNSVGKGKQTTIGPDNVSYRDLFAKELPYASIRTYDIGYMLVCK